LFDLFGGFLFLLLPFDVEFEAFAPGALGQLVGDGTGELEVGF